VAKAKTPDDFDFIYKPLSPAQEVAAELWPRSRILFFVGLAGSGKTTAALGMALRDALRVAHREQHGRMKLWLSRPTVACGESLGFLPGDVAEKLSPWLAPFHDCFGDLSNASWDALTKKVEIETVPVGMLRGRTIRNGVLIVDESQQLSPDQIKCIATRLGRNSKIVFCGDPAQSDVYTVRSSPLLEAAKKLDDLDTVATVRFTKNDQLRDQLVSDILDRL
jgi:phosphate starvation-inducible PhoH-like protein